MKKDIEILEKISPWVQKVKRTATSVLPIDDNRNGICKRCGKCCILPNRCAFLSFEDEDNIKNPLCNIYHIRPLNCRKYPRCKDEQVITSCGYFFK